MEKRDIILLIISVGVCQLAGIIGSVFTTPAIGTWYAVLVRPEFGPPNWLFAPVWITLFALMGISLYLVIRKGLNDKKVKLGVLFFGVQLALNTVWSFLFFGLRNPYYAFIEIIILWFAILLTIYQFLKIDRKAAYLLVPYILWVTFAAVLNYYIWILN